MRTLLFWSIQYLYPYLFVCADINSYEANRLEITPIYDIILFNDIADVINDIESGVNAQAEAITESDSNENVDDLLLEYQHYLDKAHKQRLDYLDKVSGKNKVPLLRHDKYPKMKSTTKSNYGDYYKPISYNNQPPTKLFSNFDSFLPKYMRNSQYSYDTSTPHVQKYKQISPFQTDYSQNRNQIYGNSYDSQQLNKHVPPSCYCRTNEIPCKCECKQCIVTFASEPNTNDLLQTVYNGPNMYFDPMFEKILSKDVKNINDNDLKVRIKIDIKLPKIFEMIAKLYENRSTESKVELERIFMNDSPTNLFSPYSKQTNFIDLFSYNPVSALSDSLPLQRITIHKKKKTRANTNKKHRKKPLFVHETNIIKNETINVSNLSDLVNSTFFIQNKTVSNVSNVSNVTQSSTRKSVYKSEKPRPKEFIYVTLNITNNNENQTDEVAGTENSIETGEFNIKENKTIQGINLRDKRETILSHITLPFETEKKSNNTTDEIHNYKYEKILNDPNLLYWPENAASQSNKSSKNINALIINTEKGKTKFNMSKENMRQNHSMALEKAIFGDVDWNDIDTVAPMFISFVGKYVKGVLTFCSDTVCHSMNCAEKSCSHRKCEPTSRYNKIGHCLGTKDTDSIAKMEHVMDLPSNVASEVVDILKEKMLSKVFGKMTICIGLKCITFVAIKKTVIKSKCTLKELTSNKECPFLRKL